MKKICEVCGREFEAKRADARYCPGGTCRQAAKRLSVTGPLDNVTDKPDVVTDKLSVTDTRHPMNRIKFVVDTTPEQEAELRARYPNLTAIRKALMNQYAPPVDPDKLARMKARLAKINIHDGVSAVRGEVE